MAVINASSEVYNLCAHRALNYFRSQGYEAILSDHVNLFTLKASRFIFSIIFTYDILNLIPQVLLVKDRGAEVEIGGPGATAMPDYIEQVTGGVRPYAGLDSRFENFPGEYEGTFSSRGCPRSCPFCLVPRLEGRRIVEIPDFPIPVGPNPKLLDNNILATSWSHQQKVVGRLKGVRNLDVNSGWDCRIFAKDPERYWQLYNELNLDTWRLAYDVPEEREPVGQCIRFLRSKGVDYRRITVFALIGYPGQTFDECLEKLQYLVNMECSPYPMRYRPLDALTRNYVAPGWTAGQVEGLFGYFGVPWVWRSCTWDEYVADSDTSTILTL